MPNCERFLFIFNITAFFILFFSVTVIKDRNSYIQFAEPIPDNTEPENANELEISSS